MDTVTVRTIPLGDTTYLDCNKCGPLGFSPPDQAKADATDHLETHGIDVTELRSPT